MDKIEKGQLCYHPLLTYPDALFFDEGDDIPSCFKRGTMIEQSKFTMLGLTAGNRMASP